MGATDLGTPGGTDQATIVLNPLASHAPLKNGDVEASTVPTTPTRSTNSFPARAAAAVVLGHAAAFWGLFLGVGTSGQPGALAAATAAYEATALLTAVTLFALWLCDRRTAAATNPPPLLSIPAAAALFGLQWPAFSYLLIAACCRRA